jgi:hypothetical protein
MIGKPLENIKYPVYPLRGYTKITDINGVVKVHTHYNIYIIDDRNLEGKTLGERRLRLKKFKYSLPTSVANAKDVIMSSKKVFIDDEGVIFKYVKTRKARLIYKQIAELVRLPFETTKIIVRGIHTPFIMHQDIPLDYAYAGVLQFDGGYILYEVSKKKKPDSWRKV